MFSDFKQHLLVAASGRCYWQPIERINCFYYGMYFKLYIFKIETTGLMYFLNKLSLRMLIR